MIHLDGSSLTLDQLEQIARHGAPVGLTAPAIARVEASRAVVDAHAQRGAAVYGVNTLAVPARHETAG